MPRGVSAECKQRRVTGNVLVSPEGRRVWSGKGCRRPGDSRATQETLSHLRGQCPAPCRDVAVGSEQFRMGVACTDDVDAQKVGEVRLMTQVFYALFLCFLLIHFVQSNSQA